MAWVVKEWRPEVLAETEREARRVVRDAEREARDVYAHMVVLEDLGAELREHVRRRRREAPVRPPEVAPAPLPIPRRPSPPDAPPRSRGPGRARMRESPLAELFRTT